MSMEIEYCVYAIINKINGSVYIGKSYRVSRRWKTHVRDALENDSQLPLHRAIRKHGIESFDFVIVEKCVDDRASLDAEVKHIREYRERGVTLYNLTDGGDGARGMKMSAEAKAAISFKKKGTKHSEETRKRIGDIQRGKKRGPYPPERMKAAREASIGRHLTDEEKQHLRDVQLGRKRPKAPDVRERLRLKRETHEAQAYALFTAGKTLLEISQETGYTVGSLKKLRTQWNKIKCESLSTNFDNSSDAK